MKRLQTLLILMWGLCLGCDAQEETRDPLVSVNFDARFDAQRQTYGKDEAGVRPETKGGFEGRYIKLVLNGAISDKFRYTFRHRLYRNNDESKKFFNATDWLYLTYQPTDNWAFVAGKQVVMIGTMEYDYAPIDVYDPMSSDFWNHIDCYQLGVAAAYMPASGQKLCFQVTNSPTSRQSLEDIYAYNLIWYGSIGKHWSTIYSANMIEVRKDHYIHYLALGNKLKWNWGDIDLDFMNRYGGKHCGFFEDLTFSSKVNCHATSRLNVFVKGGYDVNHAQRSDTPEAERTDTYVLPGVERAFWGAGLEYFPLVSDHQKVRAHAFWSGSNEKPRCNTFNVGIRWQMNVLNWRQSKN